MNRPELLRSLKLNIKLLLAKLNDFRKGYRFSFAQGGRLAIEYRYQLQLQQQLFPNEAKVHNLKKAIQAIKDIHILPNEIFSFWKIVGRPSLKNGFAASRSIVNNQIVPSIGGGLCQLSGLIYFLSLQAQLDILERHNHSVDIYTEETRFTPLGSDAAVVYGYKDLKIRNNTGGAINFSFAIQTDQIVVKLHHNSAIQQVDLDFKHHHTDKSMIQVHTFQNGHMIATSTYKKPA